MHTFQFTVHLYDYEHANVSWPHMINLPSGTTMSNFEKNYHAALRTYESQIPDEVSLVILFRPLCINQIIFFIIINSFNTTVATLCNWIDS